MEKPNRFPFPFAKPLQLVKQNKSIRINSSVFNKNSSGNVVLVVVVED